MKHQGSKVLQTKRLTLRPFTIEDGEEMFQHWASDPVVTKTMLWETYTHPNECREYLQNMVIPHYAREDYYMWGIVYDNKLIGSFDLRPSFFAYEFGYVIGAPWWGKGIMTEALGKVLQFALEECEIPKIFSMHSATNPASGRVMEKCGMRQEGCLKKQYPEKDGSYSDMPLYGILREEYKKIKSAPKAMK